MFPYAGTAPTLKLLLSGSPTLALSSPHASEWTVFVIACLLDDGSYAASGCLSIKAFAIVTLRVTAMFRRYNSTTVDKLQELFAPLWTFFIINIS